MNEVKTFFSLRQNFPANCQSEAASDLQTGSKNAEQTPKTYIPYQNEISKMKRTSH